MRKSHHSGFVRVKSTGTYQYLQIAQSFRAEGKVRQRVIATVGRLDVLKQSGQLDSFLRSGLRLSERIGPDLVFGRLWEESGIASMLKELISKRNFGFEVERAVYLTVLHRLFSPGSNWAVETWRKDYRIPSVAGLECATLLPGHGLVG